MSDRTDRVRAAVARAWEEARPIALQRLSALEEAARSLRAGRLSEPQRWSAESLAHQLAGSLGTYGFREASAAAHEVELLLSSPHLEPTHAEDLLRHVGAARRMVQEQARRGVDG